MSTICTRTALSFGLFSLISATPALAEPETRSVTVLTADLNLATAAGEHTLHDRISHAVGLVCGNADPRDLRASSAIQACRDAALAKAMPQMRLAIANARSAPAYAAVDARIARPAS